jgi:hypothetical protein
MTITTNLPKLLLTLALTSSSIFANAPTQQAKKTITNQSKKVISNRPLTNSTSQAPKKPTVSKKQKNQETLNKYLSIEIGNLECDINPRIKQLEYDRDTYANGSGIYIDSMNKAIKNEQEEIKIRDNIQFRFSLRLRNISNELIQQCKFKYHFIFPSGKKLTTDSFWSTTFLNIEPTDNYQRTNEEKPFTIFKNYKYHKADPTQPTTEEIQEAINNKTYKIEIECIWLATYDGIKRKYPIADHSQGL